jgi:NAD(P)-dependent dehydrogenase (short-subunit alcohol dehydrogenase family)
MMNSDYAAGSMGIASIMAFTAPSARRAFDFGVRVVGINPAGDADGAHGDAAARPGREGSGRCRALAGADPAHARSGRLRAAGIADLTVFSPLERAAYISGTVINVDAGR